MVRIGRYTAALSLTALGILLLLDHAGYLDALGILRVWWPAALVALGVELIIVQSLNKQEISRVKIAFGTLFGAVAFGSLVLAAAKGDELRLGEWQEWRDGVRWGLFDSDQAKHSFDKGVTVVPMRDPERPVVISNVNGNITLTEGPVADIEVKAVVYVDVSDRKQAEELADRSSIQVTEGSRTEITAHGESYGFVNLRKPRIDMIVTFPQGRNLSSLELDLTTGSVRMERLTVPADIRMEVTNGEITGEQIDGTLHVKLINGDIRLFGLERDAELEIVNGEMEVADPQAALSAKTVNGDIEIRSATIGGDWTVNSTMGDLTLAWPEGAGVNVKAKSSFDHVDTAWPLSVSEHEASGKLGSGDWQITAETNAKITLDAYGP